jgi:uncharacterized protein (TIGR02231 family)
MSWSGATAVTERVTKVEVESRATAVTLFEDRAEVKREARASVPEGTSWVAVRGGSLVVDDASVIAGVRSERARMVASRVVRQVRQAQSASFEALAALEKELLASRALRARAEQAVTRAETARGQVGQLLAASLAALERVPRRAAEAVPSARQAYGAMLEALVGSLDAWGVARAELRRATDDEQLCQARLAQGRTFTPRHEAAIEVQVEATEAAEVELELTYRVPCALWRPEHLARLEGLDEGKPAIRLQTFATVWQTTGEAWADVQARFSTARPARAATAPHLTEDVLHARRKSAEERKVITVEARDQDIKVAGLGRGTRDVQEMPGVDDGGQPLTFSALRPTTLPGDGRPFRVDLGETVFPATVDTVAFPERGMGAHVRALATLKRPTPLLAGPVWVARGTELVGRSRTLFVAAGEPFELGFGLDDGLRVRRTQTEKRETVPVIGTQKITRTVTLFVSNLSGARKKLTVTERVPVSEIADLHVEWLSSEGARLDKKDGFAHYDLEVAPNGTVVAKLQYRLEASSKVRLPF